MVDWPTFSAFNGTLKRETLVDDSLIPDPVQPAQPGENNFTRVERDILKWEAWMTKLRNADPTERTAMFGGFADDAKLVIDTFFPKDADPKRVRDKADKSQEYVADPLVVNFGAASPLQKLELFDSPSALAYLFSNARPGAGARDYRITGVPVMSFVSYVETGDRKYDRYVFGSTFAVGAASVANSDVIQKKCQTLLENWRRELMNQCVHNQVYHLLPTFPGFPFTFLSPKHHQQLCGNLFLRLVDDEVFCTAVVAAFAALSVAQTAELLQTKTPFEFIPQDKVYATAKYKLAIMETLKQIIKDRFNVSYSPATTNIPAILKDFAELYLMPKLFQPRMPPGEGKMKLDSPIEEPKSPVYTGAKKLALDTFWLIAFKPIQDVVGDLYHAVGYNHVRPESSTWGRCAETCCFSGMLYQWWPEVQNQVRMSDVKGFAMQSRIIGPSDLKPFDTKMLGALKGDVAGVYRLPCENCNDLMPFFDMKADGYSAVVMNTIPDQTIKLK
ncbi:hypothetical protein BGZ57DRAFT_934964 [Hyaloscypha finlandica]|nr:hypothetical protein BGZ57DRAFT_934964 [Hyaloscypha finlandica]